MCSPIASTINFPTIISNDSCTVIDNIFIDSSRHDFSVYPHNNGLRSRARNPGPVGAQHTGPGFPVWLPRRKHRPDRHVPERLPHQDVRELTSRQHLDCELFPVYGNPCVVQFSLTRATSCITMEETSRHFYLLQSRSVFQTLHRHQNYASLINHWLNLPNLSSRTRPWG
jgi:hypothetical protein